MKKTSLHLVFCLILFLPLLSLANTDETARTFSKTATYIFNLDHAIEPVTDFFSKQELKILEKNKTELDPMIGMALQFQHSVGGAKLMAHFGLKTHLSFLRKRFLEPGRPYGWESSTTSPKEREAELLQDHQYPYAHQYLEALEKLMQKKIHKIIKLTPEEKRSLVIRATSYNANNHDEWTEHLWARWMQKKLKI